MSDQLSVSVKLGGAEFQANGEPSLVMKAFDFFVESLKGRGAVPDVTALAVSSPRFRFSIRALNILRRAGVSIIADLVNLTADDLLEQRNCGETVINEIRTALELNGLRLKGE